MPQGYEGLPDYYLKSSNPITPNLGLSLKGMDAIVAEDFVLIDTAIGGGGTAIQVNGAVIPAANFIDSATVTFTVLGSNVSAHAAAGVDVNGAPIAAPNFNNLAPAAPPGGTNVLWQVLGGSISAYVVIPAAGVFPVTKAAIASNWLNSYDAVTGLFTATQPNYTDIAGVVPTPPSGSVLWSAIGNAAGALTLANANYATTFNQTSAVNWTWANTTAAISPIPAIGLGAINAASISSGAASTNPLSITLNINIGDFVIIFTNTADGSETLADNGASGGNTYTKLGVALTARAIGKAWYTTATKTASSVTVTDAAGCLALSGATFINASGIGASATGSAYNNSITNTLATTAASSLVILGVQFAASTILTPTSGSILTSAFSALDVVSTAILDLAAPTIGSYSLSATSNTGLPDWQGWAIELLSSNSTTSSPILKLSGTYWNGAASAVDAWTVQDVISNTLNGTSTLTFTHTGSTGSAAVRVPLLDIDGTDAGISRLGAASLAVGNGTANNTSGKLTLAHMNLTSLDVYLSNALAITGGLAAGDLYRTGSDPDVVCIVH